MTVRRHDPEPATYASLLLALLCWHGYIPQQKTTNEHYTAHIVMENLGGIMKGHGAHNNCYVRLCARCPSALRGGGSWRTRRGATTRRSQKGPCHPLRTTSWRGGSLPWKASCRDPGHTSRPCASQPCASAWPIEAKGKANAPSWTTKKLRTWKNASSHTGMDKMQNLIDPNG